MKSARASVGLPYRYRIVIHPGDAKSADIAALWNRNAGAK